jgi:glutamine synthetase
MGDTLYIPCAFITHQGDAIDHKTPLLRARVRPPPPLSSTRCLTHLCRQDAVSRQAVRLLHLLGQTDVKYVNSNVGWEQEYFIVPQNLFVKRPDLLNCGRTLFGAMCPRNQELAEHYFAAPSPVIRQFMDDVQTELWSLGISLNVNHNEVSPSQHELSPIFTTTNAAADQNMVTMQVMDAVAAKYGLKVLWHEKPYAGINGSGKHSNWSLNTDTGRFVFAVSQPLTSQTVHPLTEPLAQPEPDETSQQIFFAFVAAVTHAVAKHGDLLRVAVSGAGNDHRLGAHEAPPAIISLYTGNRHEPLA